MGYIVGFALALVVSIHARAIGLDRGRAFYATVAMIVATYYVLFAVMGGSLQVLAIESVVMIGFVSAAMLGFKRSSWLIAACLAGHGVFDAVHGVLYTNPGVPAWWPPFCGTYDVTAAVLLAITLKEIPMNALPSSPNRFRRCYAMAATVLGAVALFAAAAHAGPAGMHRAEPPAQSEFGLGPRFSAAGHYTATLHPAGPLRQRELQSVRVFVADAEGHAVDGATIEVDGGMPQHGHGLPTRPRVTKSFGDGLYEIEGVRFNMGGWWVFSLAITGSAGTDKVTFNIQL